MAILFDKGKEKYIDLQLFSINESWWIGYKIFGGKIYHHKKIEWFRLDNAGLVFFDFEPCEKEVEDIIDSLRNIKELLHYRFEPNDDGEFVLTADFKNDIIYIKWYFRVIDRIVETEIQDNTFHIETTESLLHEFLENLKKEYDRVTK